MYKRKLHFLFSIFILLNASCGYSNDKTQLGNEENAASEIKCTISSYQKNISYPFIGFNTNTIKGPKWTDKQFQGILQKFNPQFLRYPGGTVSSIWDWKKGGFVDNLPEEALEERDVGKRDIVTATLEEFKTAIDATGATPVFVLNMVTSDLKDQLEMLRHAKQIGMTVTYVELGNEYYKSQKVFTSKFPSPTDYGKEAVRWAKEIEKEFPETEFAVIATRKGQDKDERLQSWNQGVFEVIKNEKIIDAITIHPYAGPGHGVKEIKDAMDISDMANVLGASFNGELLLEVNPPQGKKIWITEFNAFDVKKDVMNSRWVHGLYVANMTLGFLNNQNVDMVLYHSLIGNPSFRAIFTGTSDLKNAGSTKVTKPFDFSAAGYAYYIILNAMKDKEIATRLDFTTNITQSSFSKTFNALVGWNLKGKNNSETIFLNLSDKEVSIDIKDVKLKEGTGYQTYSVSSPVDFWANSDAVTKKSSVVQNQKIRLPAYSIVTIK